MKSNIPEKFAAKVNEFMILRDLRLAPGLIAGPSFIEGSWCEAWVVFKDKSDNLEMSEEEEALRNDIFAKLKAKGFEYVVRQVRVVDKYSPLRCEAGDFFYAASDPELVKMLEESTRPVTSRKPAKRPPDQTQS